MAGSIGDSRQILICFSPPEEISQKIIPLRILLSEKFHNTYHYYLAKVHLMVYLSPMPKENLEKILRVTEEVVQKTTPFTVTLGDFELGSGGWESFSDEEKQRILDTGIPYLYHPHMTIALLPEDETRAALKELEGKSLRGLSFTADYLEVAGERQDPST